MDNIRIHMLTYNVGTKNPVGSLHELLSLQNNSKSDKSFYDLYVISLQEVKAQPQNILFDALFYDPWTCAFRDILSPHYVKIKTIRLQGLLLSVYGLRKHLLNIRDVETEYTRTGLSGLWGNKGAVSVRLSIYGCSICFVNSHLSAHDNQLSNRIADYNSIIQDQVFHVSENTQIFYHDYVFWMGDLNFRLHENYKKSAVEIRNLIKKGELEQLFEKDELRAVMQSGEAFSELTEIPPTFPPTYKYEMGTSNYDIKRRPAWTDRILYKVNSHNYENVTLKLEQKSYTAHNQFVISDHKPVTSDFIIKVFADYAEAIVLFDKINVWYSNEENTVFYQIKKGFSESRNDWIGIFKQDFDTLDEYIMYEYVSKSEGPIVSAESSSGHGSNMPQMKYRIIFPELPNRNAGLFCLVYFSVSENNVQSVVGISDPFLLEERQT